VRHGKQVVKLDKINVRICRFWQQQSICALSVTRETSKASFRKVIYWCDVASICASRALSNCNCTFPHPAAPPAAFLNTSGWFVNVPLFNSKDKEKRYALNTLRCWHSKREVHPHRCF